MNISVGSRNLFRKIYDIQFHPLLKITMDTEVAMIKEDAILRNGSRLVNKKPLTMKR